MLLIWNDSVWEEESAKCPLSSVNWLCLTVAKPPHKISYILNHLKGTCQGCRLPRRISVKRACPKPHVLKLCNASSIPLLLESDLQTHWICVPILCLHNIMAWNGLITDLWFYRQHAWNTMIIMHIIAMQIMLLYQIGVVFISQYGAVLCLGLCNFIQPWKS